MILKVMVEPRGKWSFMLESTDLKAPIEEVGEDNRLSVSVPVGLVIK